MKIIFVLLIFFSLAFGEFQKVSIGKIDERYSDVLSEQELYQIIKEIENRFESQLGIDVFDYSKDGKPIDIIYMPPSKKKKKLAYNLKKMKSIKKDMDALLVYIEPKKRSIELSQKRLNNDYSVLNKAIKRLNNYVLKSNQKSTQISKIEYEKIKTNISNKQKKILREKTILNKKKKKLNRKISIFKQKLRKYNLLVKRYNRLLRYSENLSKSIVEVKGVTKMQIKTIYMDNSKISSKTYMEKIEIYNFENLKQLKIILAHEIGHLVGVEHIDADGALMNPYLQKEQLDDFSLTHDDMYLFHKAFL